MAKKSELEIPDIAQKTPDSIEILRVWIAGQQQHVSLRSDVWEDPAAWGIMLVDLARHVANAYRQSSGYDLHKTLKRIKAGWEAEIDSPTDSASGKTV